MKDVVYLYGFVPAAAPSPPAVLAGIADAPVELADVGAVRAVISRLPAAEWDGAVIESRLQDLQWVGQQGLAHERVVLWFVDHGEILPARLFSLHSDESALRAATAGAAARMAAQLEQLAGRREWNLKVACDAAELARHGGELSRELKRLEEELAAAAPGRRYLLERRRADVQKREVLRSARRLADELFDALRAHAEAVRVLPLASEGEDAGRVLLNAALLVHREREAALRAEAGQRIADMEPLGMIARLTGPWAPYRFLETDVDA